MSSPADQFLNKPSYGAADLFVYFDCLFTTPHT